MSARTDDAVIPYVASAFTVGGVSRDQLLREAYNNNAPHSVIVALLELPASYFWTVDDVASGLVGNGS